MISTAFSDIFTIARAAAQLWTYAREYPGARLFIACTSARLTRCKSVPQ
jgi:hypothetical protein